MKNALKKQKAQLLQGLEGSSEPVLIHQATRGN